MGTEPKHTPNTTMQIILVVVFAALLAVLAFAAASIVLV